MGTGYLTAETRTGEQAVPVARARVQIIDEEGAALYDLITDENGLTEQVTLNTVDREKSLDPNYSGHPYTAYNLQMEA